MLTRDDLLFALERVRVSAPVRADEVTGSTNTTAAELAEDGAPEWTLVSARHQTAGRGRMGRSWQDAEGRAMLVSFVLRPSLAPNRAGLLSLLAGASMAVAIREVTGLRAACSWPNDVIVGQEKVGGILLESSLSGDRLEWVVVGVGVNVDPPDGVEGAGGVGEVSVRELLAIFLERFERVYDAVEPSWEERVRNEWLPVASTIGQIVEATTTDGRAVRGRATGIDPFGALLLSTDAGEVQVAFGQVKKLHGG